jgi:hypothetical protein
MITATEWEAFLDDLQQSLDKFAVPQAEQAEIKAIVASTRADIVILSYAPASGIFRWKVSASTRAPVGTIAGAKNGRGYRQIRFDGRPYSASRFAWLYMTGKWPNSEISYVNSKPSDTRWANLREATSSPNRNRPKRK